MARTINMTAFWNIADNNLTGVYRRFGGTYCLHHQDDNGDYVPLSRATTHTRLHGYISQKAVILIKF
jgi:hypothetical protein